jgi:hypothetical protein
LLTVHRIVYAGHCLREMSAGRDVRTNGLDLADRVVIPQAASASGLVAQRRLFALTAVVAGVARVRTVGV